MAQHEFMRQQAQQAGLKGYQLYTPPEGGEPMWAAPGQKPMPSGLPAGTTKIAGGGTGATIPTSEAEFGLAI